jgi:hypothetical protein
MDAREGTDMNFEEELRGISLTESQTADARICFEQHPEGFQRCVEKALRFDRPGARLVVMLKRDQHLGAVYAEVDTEERITGWKFKHGANGEGGGTYVRDPEGVDPLPKGYDLTPASYRFNAEKPHG